MVRKLPPKFNANPNALPPLLDKEAEIKRLDSIRENAEEELKEIDRLEQLKFKDKEILSS